MPVRHALPGRCAARPDRRRAVLRQQDAALQLAAVVRGARCPIRRAAAADWLCSLHAARTDGPRLGTLARRDACRTRRRHASAVGHRARSHCLADGHGRHPRAGNAPRGRSAGALGGSCSLSVRACFGIEPGQADPSAAVGGVAAVRRPLASDRHGRSGRALFPPAVGSGRLAPSALRLSGAPGGGGCRGRVRGPSGRDG